MIDILLPFYGDPTLLRATVQSIQAQTSPHWRLLVADDGYPDPAVARWFGELGDPRVHYTRFEENVGANLNYMRALDLAEAEYVVVMGADDLMLPTYVEAVERAIAAHPQVEIIQPGVEVIDENGRRCLPLGDRIKRWLNPVRHTPKVLSGEPLLVSLLRGNWTYFPSLCWRRDAIADGFRPGLHVVQDLALLVDVVRAGGSMVVLAEPTFQYRRHGGSDSSRKTMTGDRFAEELAYFTQIERELRADSKPRAARAARTHLTSRLHALALLPAALSARDLSATRTLGRQAFGVQRPDA